MGSAIGPPALLYGLLRVTMMAPRGPVAIFPSNHYVSDDAAFIAHVEGAHLFGIKTRV